MTLKEIKELVQLVLDSGVAELEVKRGDDTVRIRRSVAATTQEIVVPAAPPQAVPEEAAPAGKAEEENIEHVKSPIVGTFYEAPAPDVAPFVEVGDHVSAGQVLCIIESMKLMNEIEAEFPGTIVSKLVENGRPVEYGEALFAVERD